MSRSPWLWFVLIGLVPVLVFSLGRFGISWYADLFPALAAVLVVSTGNAPEPLPGGLQKRFMLGAGVVVVLLGTELVASGASQLVYSALAVGVPAVLAAWVLSAAYSPSPAARDLVRGLVAAGATPATLLVAVLAWPVARTLAVAASAHLADAAVTAPTRFGLGYLGANIIFAVVVEALVAIAWYGFAARRLLRRISPLWAGLLIGATQWAIVWLPRLTPAGAERGAFLWDLAGSAAAGVVTVWVYDRSRGSLLAVWLMGIMLSVSTLLALVTVEIGAQEHWATPDRLFAIAEIALAAALVAAGRMWRASARTGDATPDSDTPELSLP